MKKIYMFFKLVYNENIKFLYNKKTIIFSSILIIILLISLISEIRSNIDWKVKVADDLKISISERDSLLKELEEQNDPELKNVVLDVIKNKDYEIMKLRYHLEKDIPYKVQTPWMFIYNSLSKSWLIFIFLIIYSSDIIVKEYTGTIKQLLIKPHKRWKILLSKYLSVICAITGFLALLFLSSLIMGFFGFYTKGNNAIEVIVKDGIIFERDIKEYVIFSYFTLYFKYIMYTSISFMLAVIFKNAKASLIVSLVSWGITGVLNSFVGSSINSNWYIKYLVFPHMDLSQYLSGENISVPNGTFEMSLTIDILYLLMFIGTSMIIFSKRNVNE